MEFLTRSGELVPYEFLHGKEGDPVCPCMEGHAVYLSLFPPGLRDQVFSVLGPHPTLSELLATIRLNRVSDAYLQEYALEPCGRGSVLRPSATSLFGDVAFYNAAVPASGKVWWFDGAARVLHSTECALRDIPTYRDNGYCYLGLYPRDRWFDIGRRLGAWPTASMLPSGRFPAAVAAVAAPALAGLCHVEALVPTALDQLAAVPASVRVGGSAFRVSSEASQFGRLYPPTDANVAAEVRAVESVVVSDSFFYRDVPPGRVGPRYQRVEPGEYAVVQSYYDGHNVVSVGGDAWVLCVPPGSGVSRGGVVLSARDRYLFVHGTGVATFEWLGSRRWLLAQGGTRSASAGLLRGFDPVAGTDYADLPCVGCYIPADVDPGPPQRGFSPVAVSKTWHSQVGRVPAVSRFSACFVDSGLYLEPDGVSLTVAGLVVSPGVRVRLLCPARSPGGVFWADVRVFSPPDRTQDSLVAGLVSAYAPTAFLRGPEVDLPDGTGVKLVWPCGFGFDPMSFAVL
jgi:hypothetical protein